MSQRMTLGSLKSDSRLLERLGLCADDPRVAKWVSSFQERALNEGRWFGTTQLCRFCITDGCVVLPREVAVIEAAKINDVPMRSVNQWYSMVRPHISTCCSGPSTGIPPITIGYGTCNCGCGCGPIDLADRDTVSSFKTTTGTNQKIRTYMGGLSDVGKKLIYQGYDKNGVWVRTTIDGVVSDGEQVVITDPFVDTNTIWGAGNPLRVIKDTTDYPVQVFSVDQTDATEVQLANYQPSETMPMYQRVSIPDFRYIRQQSRNCTPTLMAIVSLQQIPIKLDSDWLLFTNMGAYVEGSVSEKMREDGNIALADALFFGNPRPSNANRGARRLSDGSGALPSLRAELRKMTGDKTTVNMTYAGVDLAGWR